jgi:ABC-type multidrug transport system ATPase subunit
VTFFHILTEIVGEKESRLRLGMRMMGLKTSVYWLVWFFTGALYILLSTLVLIGAGLACQFAFFVNSNFFAVFLLFFLFGIAMVCFAFWLSSLISSSKTAQTVGYAIILVGFVFQAIMSSGNGALVDMLWADDLPPWVLFVRWVLTQYPPFNFDKAFADIAFKSSDTLNLSEGRIVKGKGFEWDDLFEGRAINFFGTHVEIPAPMQQILWLVINTAIYGLVGLYLDNVLPGEHGSPRHLFFFLDPYYWGWKKAKIRMKDTDDALEHNRDAFARGEYDEYVQEEVTRAIEDTENDSAVRVMQMTKKYRHYLCLPSQRDVTAVDNLSFTIDEGEIFCLLGHNGAGKTTTINMMTGLFTPSSGTAFIYGHNVLSDMDEIQNITGVCPQHNILWDELTAREHLIFFAVLKRIPPMQIRDEVNDKLHQMGLSSVADDRVGSFSGGMKRRLSVAISAIGDPKIIFMDEPTTGLDPVHKREVWHLIESIRKERVILLTTHSMEEADVLASRIAIMSGGKLRCLGNSLHLKSTYGTGYRINALLKSTDMFQPFVERLYAHWPWLKGHVTGSLVQRSVILTVDTEHKSFVPELVKFVGRSDLVSEWGMSHSTLEDVFLHVTSKHSEEVREMHLNDNVDDVLRQHNSASINDTNSNESDNEQGTHVHIDQQHYLDVSQSFPFRALFRKNFSLQKRQTFTNLCQILTPVLVMAILVLLQLIIRAQLGDNFNKRELVPSVPFPLNEHGLKSPFAANDVLFMQYMETKHLQQRMYDLTSEEMPQDTNNTSAATCFTYFLMSSDSETMNHSIGYAAEDGARAGLLGQINQRTCQLLNDTTLQVPFFEKRSSYEEIQGELFHDIVTLNNNSLTDVQQPPLMYLLPDGYVSFHELNVTAAKLKYTMSVNDNIVYKYHRANNFTRLDLPGNLTINIPGSTLDLTGQILIVKEGQMQLLSLINQAFMAQVGDQHHIAQPGNDTKSMWLNARFVQRMPYYASANLLAILEAFGAFLYPVALCLQLPIYIYLLVLEKSQKLKDMMQAHGMQSRHYVATNYIFFYLLYMLAFGFLWLSGLAAEIRFFTQTDPLLLFLFLFGWGHCLIALAFLISTFLSSPRASTLVGYTIALLGTLIAEVVSIGIYGPFAFSIGTELPKWLLIWPQFSFVRGIYLLNDACAQRFSCYGPLWTLSIDDEFIDCLFFLYGAALVYGALAVCAQRGWRRTFFCQRVVTSHRPSVATPTSSGYGQSLQEMPKEAENEALLNEEAGVMAQEDPDCRNERKRVHDGDYPNNAPLVVGDLHHEYGPNKSALSSLCLVVEEGECFGLLGENGAGKTTTIGILTGLVTPTSGWAMVAGYDVTTDLPNVQRRIGVCPQFDVLWDTLTVEEHLLFYARLKGIAPGQEKDHTHKLLQQVGLFNVRTRLAGNLSGGMKRRLSVAIALVGNSRIVFLDEPTTGLDPASRRQLWDIILAARQGRAVLLTTHSMEEAEILCTRLGILAKGVLCCLGTQQHLKNTYGEGFRLQINFDVRDEERAREFILKTFDNATMLATFKGTEEYQLEKDTPVHRVFDVMEKFAARQGIIDWSITQIGLLDVFQKIVAASHFLDPSEEDIFTTV